MENSKGKGKLETNVWETLLYKTDFFYFVCVCIYERLWFEKGHTNLSKIRYECTLKPRKAFLKG
jgi:hypothetical protein